MHTQIGYDILSKSSKLEDIAQIVLYHHERWDGKLKKSELLLDNWPKKL